MSNTPDSPGTPDAEHPYDPLITTHDLDRTSPRLDTDGAVPLHHILRAAFSTRRSPEWIRARLAELGFGRLPQGPFPEAVSQHDLGLLSRDLNGLHPWLEEPEGAKAPMGLILHVASRLQRPPGEIAARFATLGYQVCDGVRLPVEVRPEDLRLLSAERNSRAPWISDDDPVPLHHLLGFAHSEDGPEETVHGAVKAGDRLAELGFRLDVDMHVVTADDVLLLSRLTMDGDPPYLDPGKWVPFTRILRFACARDTRPDEIAARLPVLGYRRKPGGPLPDAVDPEDLELATRTDGGMRFWLGQHDPYRLAHIVVVAARTGRSPCEIAHRLRGLGFRIPETVPAEDVHEHDATISSRALNGLRPWLRAAEPVPHNHILQAAHATKQTAPAVVARLAELGYTDLPKSPLPDLDDGDTLAVSRDGDGKRPWLDSGARVPYGHILRAASLTGRSPADIVTLLRGLGYTDLELPDTALPDTSSRHDVRLITHLDSWRDSWLELDKPVPVPHILHGAAKTGTAPAEAARRLRALGYWHLPDSPMPESAFPGDPVLTSGVDRETTVTTGHVLSVSNTLECNPHEVANRLISLGYRLPYTPEPDDARLVSVNLDGRAPWLFLHAHVDVGHVISAALALDRVPAEIVERLAELGYPRPAMPVPDIADPDDLRVLRHERRRLAPWQVSRLRSPWLESNRAAPPAHVLRTALATGRSPRETAEHLARLGYQLDPAAKLPSAADPEDVRLLDAFSADFAVGPVSLAGILHLASNCGTSPAEVAARLTDLGFPVPDIELPAERPLFRAAPPEGTEPTGRAGPMGGQGG